MLFLLLALAFISSFGASSSSCPCLDGSSNLFDNLPVCAQVAVALDLQTCCLGQGSSIDFVGVHTNPRLPGCYPVSVLTLRSCSSNKNDIVGINLLFGDGQSNNYGGWCDLSQSYAFEFGETLVGNLILTPQSFEFTTSKPGGYFYFGNSTGQPQTLFPANGLLFLGVYGKYNPFSNLGFLLSRPIRTATLSSVTYPSLQTLSSDDIAPSFMTMRSIQNPSPVLVNQTSTMKTIGSKQCWTSPSLFMNNLTVQAATPQVNFSDSTWIMDAVLSSGQNCGANWMVLGALSDVPSFQIPPLSSCEFQISLFNLQVQTTFDGIANVVYSDNVVETYPLSGTFNGSLVSEQVTLVKCWSL
jgi:hypothetical protein